MSKTLFRAPTSGSDLSCCNGVRILNGHVQSSETGALRTNVIGVRLGRLHRSRLGCPAWEMPIGRSGRRHTGPRVLQRVVHR